VITLAHSPSDAAVPDIRFEQTSESTVRITTVGRSLDAAMEVVDLLRWMRRMFRTVTDWSGVSHCATA
jgi:hypothetical protein